MENFNSAEAAEAVALDRLSFDLLRALLAARQGASPTVRAMGAARPRMDDGALATRIALFAGAAGPLPEAAQSGAFRPHCGADAVSTDGERHV